MRKVFIFSAYFKNGLQYAISGEPQVSETFAIWYGTDAPVTHNNDNP
jgi:hypothetical protein